MGVSKKAGEMWKSLSAEKKKPFADKAQEAKKTYDAYVATSKGAAALKAYKDAIAKARAPLTKNSDAVKAKKIAAKAKAKAKREKAKARVAAKKEKVQALKEKAKARAAAAKKKANAMKAAKAEKKKAKAAAKAKAKAAKKEKAKAKAAAKAKATAAKKEKAKAKAAMKSKKSMKAPMKVATKKSKKVVKKLIEIIPDVSSIPLAMLVGAMSCSSIAVAVLHARRSVFKPTKEPLLVHAAV